MIAWLEYSAVAMAAISIVVHYYIDPEPFLALSAPQLGAFVVLSMIITTPIFYMGLVVTWMIITIVNAVVTEIDDGFTSGVSHEKKAKRSDRVSKKKTNK